MKVLASIILSAVLLCDLSGQCETWLNSPRQEDAENAHVIYRQYFKNKDYKGAFEQWEIAYNIAPAADGRRDSHFKDGIEIYKYFYKNADDEAKKKEYAARIMELYNSLTECILAGAIDYKRCSDQECLKVRAGQAKGRQAFDMYYVLQPPRGQTYEVLRESVELAGQESEYIILKPYADVVVYLYSTEQMDAATARLIHATLVDIAEYNINNNETYGEYFEAAKASMDASFSKIEGHLYDCNYFVEKMQPEYQMAPEDMENVGSIIRILKRQGCEKGEPFLDMLEAEYAEYADSVNIARQEEFEKANPAVAAKKCYDEGDWSCAIERYREAIDKEEDPKKQASYYFSIASIQFRKLNQYTRSRENAREAASLRKDWGRPYMLIGDMYAKASRNCGDDAYSRGLAVLAALDKWSYAKSIDESVAAEANRNIARFSQYMPPKDDAFMMGKKEGQTETVGCWIGESVRLRFN